MLRDGDIDALARAGCEIVWIGAESGSQKILDAMEKGTTVAQIAEAVARLRAAGVRVGFFLQFGYPGETRDDIEKTVQLVRDCQPDDIGVSVSYPLPGTKFYARVRAQIGVKQNWEDSSDLAMLYQGPFTTAFYRQLHTVIHKEFRARKNWSALRRALRTPRALRRRHLRQAASAARHALTLPLARLRLNRLARQPHDSIGPLPPGMNQAAAATPSPQDE
ncbi:MAG: radical SAM protein [Anaerolineae bacterium]|nr:radical SAM protein [Anaerolineae bacterium]